AATWPQDTPSLGVGANLVGKEHDPEEAEHKVEAGVVVRKVLGVCRFKDDVLQLNLLLRELYDRGVDVSRKDRRLRNRCTDGPCDDARPGSGFEDPSRAQQGNLLGYVV